MRNESIHTRLVFIYNRLLRRYGHQGWWPADEAFEIIVGAILTQNVAWTNVEKALANLKEVGCLTPKQLRQLPIEDLASLIRSSGYFNAKAKKLKAFAHHLSLYHDSLDAMFRKEISSLRYELLTIYGIGEETADDIILYAANKPSFVIDMYTRRIMNRVGIHPESESYHGYKALFEDNVPRDAAVYNEFHALLDRHAAEICRKRPLCTQCCLLDSCNTGQERVYKNPDHS